jgi:RNA polymerase primary sigma factor
MKIKVSRIITQYASIGIVLLGGGAPFAVAFTSINTNTLWNGESQVGFHKSSSSSLQVIHSLDEYVDSLTTPPNNNHNNNNELIEIHAPAVTNTNNNKNNNNNSNKNKKSNNSDTPSFKEYKLVSKSNGRKKKNSLGTSTRKMMDSSLPLSVSKIYQKDNVLIRLTKEQEADLANAIQGLKMASRIRDSLDQPCTEEDWAKACELTVRQLRRVMIWGREARSMMVSANEGLVRSIAKKYMGDLKRAHHGGIGTILTLQDMIQEGNLGLMEAAERFDPARGFRFSTYASHWVRQRILRSIADHSRVIRLPVHVHSILRTIRRTREDMEMEDGNSPTIEELAERLEMPVDKLKKYTDSSQMVLSLEVPLSSNNNHPKHMEDKRTLGDKIASDSPSPEEDAEFDSLRQDIRSVMDGLGPREKQVLTLRFGLEDGTPRTVEETARTLGISRDRVRNVEARALNKLRHPQRNYKLKEYVGEETNTKTHNNNNHNRIQNQSPEEIWSF